MELIRSCTIGNTTVRHAAGIGRSMGEKRKETFACATLCSAHRKDVGRLWLTCFNLVRIDHGAIICICSV